MPLVFDSGQFITDHFEGIEGVISLLGAYDFEPPQKAAVDKWLRRGSIPGEWLPKMLYVAEKRAKKPVSISSYMRKS